MLAFIALAACATGTFAALSSSLQPVPEFDHGPTGARMFMYVPASVPSPAPVVVAIHNCASSAETYFGYAKYPQLADRFGFILLYPEADSDNGCWDVSSDASLFRSQGGDSQTIINMILYAVSKFGGDLERVYVTGSSSGAMMTQVLAAAYPDVVKAASSYSGVPDGCFAVADAVPGMLTPGWNSDCASGLVTKTAEEWGRLARSHNAGNNGQYPRMIIWHGTLDRILDYNNLGQSLLQWSNLLGVSFTQNITNYPSRGYTKMVYGDGTKLVGFSALDVGHVVPAHEVVELQWFGIIPSNAVVDIMAEELGEADAAASPQASNGVSVVFVAAIVAGALSLAVAAAAAYAWMLRRGQQRLRIGKAAGKRALVHYDAVDTLELQPS
ncbi:hypothetical protein HDU84_006620 [Entophlyctis sp. JEL0112]|nr:hypothetical protein HDU84_006620 [Entophlyctis sp. JEL0112]